MELCRFALISVVSVIILMMGCSSSDDKPAESSNQPAAQPEVKQPVLYTGVEAFNRMLGLALKWAPDAQPARLETVLTSEATGQERKSSYLERLLRLAQSPRRENHRLLRSPTPRRSSIRNFDRGK